MKNRTWTALTLLGASMLLLSGCAAAADASAPPTQPSHAGAQQHSKETAAVTTSPDSTSAGAPSNAAKMICGPETVHAVVTILGLERRPHIAKTWAHGRYTCTYHLPVGALVLSVQESADPQSALAYSTKLGATFRKTSPITGLANLGFPGYETPDGVVVFVKDNMTLEVDASGLPAKLGPHHITGNALAYQLSTDVLACWSGH